jgi:Rrf2 family protein
MKISTKGRYALRALSHLSYSYINSGNKPVSMMEISGKEKISNRYLENIFVKLRKAGLVASTKGEKGGFRLVKAPESISLLEVLTAVETDVAAARCVAKANVCYRSGRCGLRKIWQKLDVHVNGFLNKISLKEVMEAHLNQ